MLWLLSCLRSKHRHVVVVVMSLSYGGGRRLIVRCETKVVRVEDEVGVDEVDKLVIMGEDLVKLIELVEEHPIKVLGLKRISLTKELKIEEEDDELEVIKLESQETCGKGVGKGEGLGDRVEEGKGVESSPGETPAIIDITEAVAHVGPRLCHCPFAPCVPIKTTQPLRYRAPT
ncbi:hypothetical protein EDB83DRAFT_2320024 [Lactarius deliciosus]|nr:hypothetical protein EDB83DRAFT_2320024 [Lactarius deliciosus]